MLAGSNADSAAAWGRGKKCFHGLWTAISLILLIGLQEAQGTVRQLIAGMQLMPHKSCGRKVPELHAISADSVPAPLQWDKKHLLLLRLQKLRSFGVAQQI